MQSSNRWFLHFQNSDFETVVPWQSSSRGETTGWVVTGFNRKFEHSVYKENLERIL